jgi:DNA-binding transcriptional MerR regulator
MKQINFVDQKELDYLLKYKFNENYPGLEASLQLPRFTITELGVTHRDATYWDKKDILPLVQSKTNTRRKYTLKQAVWIKLIQQMRSFDMSLSQIKSIKDCILGQEANVYELIQNPNVLKVIEQIAQKAGHLDEYKELMKTKEFQESLKTESLDMFEIIILYTIVFRRDISYIVISKDECFPYCFDKHKIMAENIPGFDEYMKLPHIVLSISQAISQLIQDWMRKEWSDEISIVTNEEKKILELLRDDKTEELQIFKKDNKPERVIQVSKNKTNAIQDFANYIVRNGYQTITVSTRQGKIVNFKNEVSLKLKEK